MLKLNETLQTLDPAGALEAETGVFDVTSPTGEHYQFEGRPGERIANIPHQPGTKLRAVAPQWRVKKIRELRTEQPTGW